MWQDVVVEMTHGGRRVDQMVLESTADQAHARAGRRRGAEYVRTIEELAAAHGVSVAYDPGFPTGHRGLVIGDKIVLAHGELVARDGRAVVRDAYAWLSR